MANICNKEGFIIEVSRILEREDVKSGDDIADYLGFVKYTEEEKKLHTLVKKNPYIIELKEKFDLHDEKGNKLRY